MGEQLISSETAKLAKEKGFDVVCDYVYDIVADEKNPVITRNQYLSYFGDRFIGGPSQSLLQKWLREVHKIDVFCDCIGSGLYYSVIYDNNVKEDETDKVFEQENTTSYEEALEIGLQEGLKLIKNELVR